MLEGSSFPFQPLNGLVEIAFVVRAQAIRLPVLAVFAQGMAVGLFLAQVACAFQHFALVKGQELPSLLPGHTFPLGLALGQ